MVCNPTHPPPGTRQLSRGFARLLTLAGAALASAAIAPGAALASPSAAITITLTGTTYSVSIFNGTAIELGEVDFTFNGAPTLTNLTAPSGFITNYDQGSANIVFAENTGEFLPGSTVSPFTFTDATTPTLKVIEGLDDNGNYLSANAPFSLPTVSGQSKTDTISVGGSIAPEPASLSLIALCASGYLGMVARRQIGRIRHQSKVLKG